MNTSVKTSIFVSKEHYLAFRVAWSNAVNSEEAKSKVVPCNEYIPKETGYGYTFSEGTGRCRHDGWINAEHAVLYNLLRDKPIYYGFTIVTNRLKLINGMAPHHGFHVGVSGLHSMIRYANELLSHDKSRASASWLKYRQEEIDDFLKPFAGTVSLEMLAALKDHLPKVHGLESWTELGKNVARKILDSGFAINENIFKLAIDAKKDG